MVPDPSGGGRFVPNAENLEGRAAPTTGIIPAPVPADVNPTGTPQDPADTQTEQGYAPGLGGSGGGSGDGSAPPGVVGDSK